MKNLILVDSSVWIDYLHKRIGVFDEINSLFAEGLAFITEPVISELLRGVKNRDEFEKLKEYITAIPLNECIYEDWISAGKVSFELRKKGITIPLTDALIASVALRNDMAVFTHDKHFALIPGIKLFTMRG